MLQITESEQRVGLAAECKFGDEIDRPSEVTFGGACSIEIKSHIIVKHFEN